MRPSYCVLLVIAISRVGSAAEAASPPGAADREVAKRAVISLDGTWQIGEGTMDQVPASFDRAVPVPGLVSLATPPRG